MGYVVPAIAGIGSGVLLIGIFSMTFYSAGMQPAVDGSCDTSLEYAKSKASFHVLVPTSLPDGYSLQNVDVIPDNTVFLFYFTRPMCDPNDIARPEEGLIEIVEGPLSSVSSATSGTEYIEKQQTEYQKGGVSAETFVFKNGMRAIGYESYVASSPIIDQNGSTVATTEFERHALLRVVDDKTGTVCKIEARSSLHSLDDLVNIGESLKA